MSQVGYIHTAIGYRIFGNRNPAGAARLSGLGDDSTTMADLGFSPGQIQQILQARATGALSDNGFLFLLQGGVPTTDLDNFLNQDIGAPEGGSAGTAPAQAAAAIPTGSILVYNATIDTHFWSNESAIVAGIAGALSQVGIQIIGQSTGSASGLGNFTVQLQLQVTGSGFTLPQDARSIVDHAIYVQTGKMPLSSGAHLVSTPNTPGVSAPPGSAQSLTAWFEQNASWLFLGIGALVLLPSLIGRRR